MFWFIIYDLNLYILIIYTNSEIHHFKYSHNKQLKTVFLLFRYRATFFMSTRYNSLSSCDLNCLQASQQVCLSEVGVVLLFICKHLSLQNYEVCLKKEKKIRMPYFCRLPFIMMIFFLLSFLNGLSYVIGVDGIWKKIRCSWRISQILIRFVQFWSSYVQLSSPTNLFPR